MLSIEKNVKQGQSWLYSGTKSGHSHPIATSILISLSDDTCDYAPLCDVYGTFDRTEVTFDVHAITISGTRTNITSLFSGEQLMEIGRLMTQDPDKFAEPA